MLPKKVRLLTIPLFPYLQPGEEKSRKTKRIRPKNTLDLRNLLKEIEKGTIITLEIYGKPWSVVSVYSPYSPDVHVMLIEASPNRYLPGPEKIPEREGDCLMQLWAAIIEFIAERQINATVHLGYNWSPRSWGQEEEKTGFQSIPTKWHSQLWGWPPFYNIPEKKTKYSQWIDSASLPPSEKRLLGDNNYAESFGLLIKNKLKETFTSKTPFHKSFSSHNWLIDSRGIYASFNTSVPEILRAPKFFSHVLKPLAVQLEFMTRDLTETLTKIKCEDMDKILVETERGRPKNWERLRIKPTMQAEAYIKKAFKKKGYPESLLEAILEPVRNRCNEIGNHNNWWRKCFGYALVLSGPSKGKSGQIRIMPGVFVGPGGVVEAQGIVIKRPENKQICDSEIRRKSKVLWQLAKHLKKLGFKEYQKNQAK
jgi:hypothetical protein